MEGYGIQARLFIHFFEKRLDEYLELVKRKGVPLMALGSVAHWMIIKYSFSQNRYSPNAVFRRCEYKRCWQNCIFVPLVFFNIITTTSTKTTKRSKATISINTAAKNWCDL